jgi:hypothetical protein
MTRPLSKTKRYELVEISKKLWSCKEGYYDTTTIKIKSSR